METKDMLRQMCRQVTAEFCGKMECSECPFNKKVVATTENGEEYTHDCIGILLDWVLINA